MIKTARCVHKQTKEKLILRTESNLFTQVDEIDVEMFAKQCDPIVRNHQERRSQVYIDFLEMLRTKGQMWCISNQVVWGIPVPVFEVSDRENLLKQLKQLRIYKKPGKFFTNRDVVQHCLKVFQKHSIDVWWEWDVHDFLPEHLRPLGNYLKIRKDLVFDTQFTSGYGTAQHTMA